MSSLLARRIAAAKGDEPADMLITDVRVVNVFTGTIDKTDVAVRDGVFVGFGPRTARTVLDAGGRYMLPGFIDAHIHIESSMLSPARFAELVLPRGTTSVVADPHELVNVCGAEGLRYFTACAEALLLHLFIALPSCVPAAPFEDSGAVMTAADMEPFMREPSIAAVGEMMDFPGVIGRDPDVLAKIALGTQYGKPVNGHAPLVLGRDLDAYLAAGISDMHEASTIEEARDILRRGGYLFLRQGSASRDLLALLPAVTPENSRRCTFCCDDRHAEDLIRDGHIDNILRLAVKAGLDPVRAVTMATLNAAEALHLHGKGAIAPSRDADFVLVDNLTDFNVYQTYSKGILAAENGKAVIIMPHIPSDSVKGTMRVKPIADNAFAVRVQSGTARVIGVNHGSLITDLRVRTVRTDEDGRIILENGLAIIAVVERHKGTGKIGTGLLEGFGISGGAVATSVAHDSHNIVVAGDSEKAVRAAVDCVIAMGGGCALIQSTDNGTRVLGKLPLPLAGLMTDEDPADVSRRLAELIRLAHEELHIPPDVEPFMTLSFMALPVIPALKITARGLFDVNSFTFTELDAEK